VTPGSRFGAGILGVVAVLAAGCAVQKTRTLPDLGDWETRQAVLSETERWAFTGRIGVRAGDDGFNGQLQWRQDGPVFRARISGPLGVGTIFLNGDRRELTLTDRDGEVTELDDAERDLRIRYGWTIPVTSLRYWALGIPDPDQPAEIGLDGEGRLATLEQQGWHVVVDQYTAGGGQAMPRRVTADNADMRVRLIVDSWTFF